VTDRTTVPGKFIPQSESNFEHHKQPAYERSLCGRGQFVAQTLSCADSEGHRPKSIGASVSATVPLGASCLAVLAFVEENAS
jgi:hypothetical protein